MNALGTYLLVSLFFVFGTMIEFAIVLIIKLKLKWDAANAGEDIFSSNETVQNMNQRIYNPPFFNESRRRVSIKSKTEHANKVKDIDVCPRRKGLFDRLKKLLGKYLTYIFYGRLKHTVACA